MLGLIFQWGRVPDRCGASLAAAVEAGGRVVPSSSEDVAEAGDAAELRRAVYSEDRYRVAGESLRCEVELDSNDTAGDVSACL